MIWISIISLPLIIAVLCVLPGSGLRAGFRLMPLAPLPALILALIDKTIPRDQFSDFLLSSSFGPGPGNSTFLLVISLTWFAAALFTASGNRAGNLRTRSFCVLFLLTMCGNIGLAAALDAVTFYTFFALMTFSSYGLIVHTGQEDALRAGRIYLIMAVLGEGLLIAGIMMAAFSSPSHYFVDIGPAMAALSQGHPVFLLLFAGFGIKAGLIFMHFWLPLAHPVAPAPASAVLSGAMIKAGLLGWMNFFPVGLASFETWGKIFIILGLGGTFFGAAAGLSRNDPKTVLAYSSMSQMGLMGFCLGLGIMDKSLWILAGPALYLLVFNHGLCKSALFLGTAVAGPKTKRPWKKLSAGLLLAVPALSLAGAPFTGGSQAKYLLKEAVQVSRFHGIIPVLISLSSVITTFIVIHFMFKMFTPGKKTKPHFSIAPAWILLITVIACQPVLFHEIYPGNRVEWTKFNFFLASLWPVLSGVLIYIFARKYIQRTAFVIMGVLPDTALIIDRTWSFFNSCIRQYSLLKPDRTGISLTRFTDFFIQGRPARKLSRLLELKISTWTIFGTFCVFLIIAFALLGWKGA